MCAQQHRAEPMAPLFPQSALDEVAAAVLHEALNDVRRLGWRGAEPDTVLAQAPRVPPIVEHAEPQGGPRQTGHQQVRRRGEPRAAPPAEHRRADP
jgi:hypothetical protein